MEFQLLDRFSFQRFVGLRASSQIPDPGSDDDISMSSLVDNHV